jgi:exopolysaccharide biosynthesis WecB/TagA/CpsF family protein
VAALLAGAVSFTGIRVYICQHNRLSHEMALGWKFRIIPTLYRFLSPLAAGIVAVSDGVADDLARITGVARIRITTIHNPVIDAGFAGRATGAAPHPWLIRPPGRVFVFAGRLVAQKDPETLLRAFALVNDPDARLIILGEGPLRSALMALAARLWIATRVYFAGFQANPLPWIVRADALVLPSLYEGFGNVIVEALACGTPVIATDCPSGPAEILEGGRYGTLVPAGDPATMCAALAAHRKADFPPAVLRKRASAFTAEACVAGHIAMFRNTMRPGRDVFGLQLAPLRADQVARHVLGTPPGDMARLVVTPNTDHVRLLRKSEFAAAYDTADIVCPDGLPVAVYAWARGLRRLGRVTGCEILHLLMSSPDLSDHRLFFVVESAVTMRVLLAWAEARGLGTQIGARVAADDLLQDPQAQRDIVREAHDFAATIVIVTLGAPVSELFSYRHRALLPPCWVLCVGQALRVELGLTKRAPLMFQALGCEWIWRLWQEPKRLSGRYLRSALWFPYAVAIDLLRLRARGGSGA